MRYFFIVFVFIFTVSCKNETQSSTISNYFTYDSKNKVESAGVRLIPIKTPIGEFKVWTKRFGNNPKIKVFITAWRTSNDT